MSLFLLFHFGIGGRGLVENALMSPSEHFFGKASLSDKNWKLNEVIDLDFHSESHSLKPCIYLYGVHIEFFSPVSILYLIFYLSEIFFAFVILSTGMCMNYKKT